MKGTVNHSDNWRDPITGVHSNDAESKFARFKLFVRVKYDYVLATNVKSKSGKDRALELKLGEYVFYTNVGRDMAHVMSALAYAGDVDGAGWKF